MSNESKKTSSGSDKGVFEHIYSTPGAGWTLERPPADLKRLCETGAIVPDKALDIGCGEGFYSIYLASRGFDVLGIDLSERAIRHARQNAERAGFNIAFEAIDIANLLRLDEQFAFVLEWSVLHHVAPPERPQYVKNVADLLRHGGKYLSVCFSVEGREDDSHSTFAVSPVGTKLYYSSRDELHDLFEPHFRIIESRLTTIHGQHGQQHIANYFYLQRPT